MNNKVVVHLDLETGSLKPDAKIYSIGAVAVGSEGRIVAAFHCRISPFCLDNKVRRDDNEQWWLASNPIEYQCIKASTSSLSNTLTLFQKWCNKLPEGTEFWQKRFQDYGWLESAYDQLKLNNPISFNAVKELVTFTDAVGIQQVESSNAHNALADAKAQAMCWWAATKRLEEMKVTYYNRDNKPFNPNFSHEDPAKVRVLMEDGEGNLVDMTHVVASATDMEYLEHPNAEALILYADHLGLSLSEAFDSGFTEKYVGNHDSFIQIGPFIFQE